MTLSTSLRRAAILAASATALATVAIAPPASAEPVFVGADTYLTPFGGNYNNGGADCTVTSHTDDPGIDVPVVENGPAVTVSAASSASFGHNVATTDTGTWSSQTSGTGRVTSAGGNPSTIDLSTTTTWAVQNALPTSACARGGYSGVELFFTFTVAQAGFLHLDFRNVGAGGYGDVELDQILPSGQEGYYDNDGSGLKFNGDATIYLPAGSYEGEFYGESYVEGRTISASGTATTTVHAAFKVAGSQTTAATGKGAKYVTLPSARSCATNSVNPAVTDSKKTASKIKQVKLFVNDQLAKKIKKPNKGASAVIPVAADQSVDVTAEVTLLPKKKGKKSKVYEVSASYEACS